MPSVRKTCTCARCSAVGGAAALAVATTEDAERPRRGKKLSAGRRGRFPGVGRAAHRCFVAAERNSPSVHVVAGRRCRDRWSMIGGEAKRADAALPIWAIDGGLGRAATVGLELGSTTSWATVSGWEAGLAMLSGVVPAIEPTAVASSVWGAEASKTMPGAWSVGTGLCASSGSASVGVVGLAWESGTSESTERGPAGASQSERLGEVGAASEDAPRSSSSASGDNGFEPVVGSGPVIGERVPTCASTGVPAIASDPVGLWVGVAAALSGKVVGLSPPLPFPLLGR